MATKGGFVWQESFKAENDLSTKQYYAVEYSGVDQIDVIDAAADRAIGILMNKPKAGEAAEVCLLGKCQAITDGSGTSIGAGDYVGPNGSGKLVKKATADYSVIGIAMDASSADGTIIRVLLMPVNFFRTAGG